MKKYISSLFIACFGFTTLQAQDITDALRYAQTSLNGTARFQAMSGAFGALGGDFSSINVNPAGSAVFLNTEVGITLSNYTNRNHSDYFGTKSNQSKNSFDLNQAAAFFIFNNYNQQSNWKKLAIAVNYDVINNFNNLQFAAGTNPTNSIANYFLSYANPNQYSTSIPVSTLQNSYYDELTFREQQAFLGYQGYVINVNPSNSSNNSYVSNVPSGGNYYQEQYLESTGYNGKLSFNAATQYKDKFYFGMNLNSHFSNFRKYTSFYEENNNSQTNGVRNVLFENELNTTGNGVSFQLGAIAKVTKSLRFGLAYESPTWYTLNDELRQNIVSYGFKYGSPANPNLSYANPDSNVTIVYAPYKLRTPGKMTASMAYVINKSGLISVDFGLKNYRNTSFAPRNEFGDLNAAIDNTLASAIDLRIGAEKRIKQWSLRAGYRYEQSPYSDRKTIGDLNGMSAGFGYNFGRTKLDLSYVHAQRTSQQALYSQGFTDAPTVNSKLNNISFSLTFDL